MPRRGQYTDEQVKIMLQSYVLPQGCDAPLMPRDLKPEVVSDFIRDSVNAGLATKSITRAVRLARFYVLRDRAGPLIGLVGGRERNRAELEKSCRLIVAAGELGMAAEQEEAVKQFQRLVDEPVAREGLDVLIETFFSLPPRTPAEPLAKRVRAALEDCEKNGPEGDLGWLMNYDIRDLPWMLEEKARKDAVPTIKDDATRRRRWAEIHLGFDQKNPFNWEEHAGFYLLADVKEAGDAPAVEALKTAMSRIDPSKDEEELVKLRKTRGYRARKYFLEPLDEEQEDDLKANLRPQDDLIM